ncbi:MAG: T9SS type A sorting domain-containing protein [Fibrobacteria bacterium]|nr:T9SS type A sorting domain-containing protein [Fibrobacteria bacterium]
MKTQNKINRIIITAFLFFFLSVSGTMAKSTVWWDIFGIENCVKKGERYKKAKAGLFDAASTLRRNDEAFKALDKAQRENLDKFLEQLSETGKNATNTSITGIAPSSISSLFWSKLLTIILEINGNPESYGEMLDSLKLQILKLKKKIDKLKGEYEAGIKGRELELNKNNYKHPGNGVTKSDYSRRDSTKILEQHKGIVEHRDLLQELRELEKSIVKKINNKGKQKISLQKKSNVKTIEHEDNDDAVATIDSLKEEIEIYNDSIYDSLYRQIYDSEYENSYTTDYGTDGYIDYDSSYYEELEYLDDSPYYSEDYEYGDDMFAYSEELECPEIDDMPVPFDDNYADPFSQGPSEDIELGMDVTENWAEYELKARVRIPVGKHIKKAYLDVISKTEDQNFTSENFTHKMFTSDISSIIFEDSDWIIMEFVFPKGKYAIPAGNYNFMLTGLGKYSEEDELFQDYENYEEEILIDEYSDYDEQFLPPLDEMQFPETDIPLYPDYIDDDLMPLNSDLWTVVVNFSFNEDNTEGEKVTKVDESQETIPLLKMVNSPNPFRNRTSIEVNLAQHSQVRLSIYNAMGKEIRVLLQQEVDAGTYKQVWDGTDSRGNTMGKGVYFLKGFVDGKAFSRQLLKVE